MIGKQTRLIKLLIEQQTQIDQLKTMIDNFSSDHGKETLLNL